jgi:hypothetical protein
MKKIKFIQISVVILIILGVLLLLYSGQILTNDNYSPELNPITTISRSLFEPAYRAYRGLGVASDSEQADIWRSFMMLPFKTIGLQSVTSLLYMISMLILGGYSTYLLSKKVFKKDKSVLLISIIAALVYFSTLWTAWVFNFPVMPFVTFYGTLPLVLYAYTKLVQEVSYKNALIFLFACALFTAASVISTLFFVMVIVLGFWSFYLLTNSKNKFKIFKPLLLAFGLFIITQLFWLLPFSHYYLNNAGQIQSSSVNNAITYNTIDAEATKMTLANSTSLYTTHLDLFEDVNADSRMFADAGKYSDLDIMRIISFIPIAASVWGLLLLFYKKDFHLLPLWLLLTVSLFMLNNLNPPFGPFYKFLQSEVPFFEQVFRWPTSKFGNVFLLALSLTSAYGFITLLKLMGGMFKLPKFIKYGFTVISIFAFFALMLFYSGYIWNGNLIADRSYVEMPDDYEKLAEYLVEENITERILALPLPNNGYFREYEWGFYGSGFLHYVIDNPLVEKSLAVGSLSSESAINDIEKAYYSRDKEEFENLLTKYNIEYLMVDKSLIKGRYGFEIDWDLVDYISDGNEKVWRNGDTSLLEVKYRTSNNIMAVDDKAFSTVDQNSYQYVNAVSKTADWKIDDSYIKLEAGGIELKTPTNFYSYPISIQKKEDQLVITPVFPVINEQSIRIPSRQYRVDTNETYFDVGGYLVDSTEINDVLHLDSSFSSTNAIKVVEAHKTSLLDELSDSVVGICDGSEDDLETRGLIASKMEDKQLIIDVTRGLGCLSVPIVDEFSFLDIEIEYEAQQGDIVGYCLYSYKQKECLNSESFFYTYETEKIHTINGEVLNRIDADDEVSFNFYINAKTSTQVKVKDIKITRYTGKRWLPNQEIVNITKTLGEDGKLTIPIIQSKYNYQLDRTNPIMWNYSTDGDSLIETSDIQDIGIQTVVDHDYSYLFKELLTVKPGKDFIYAISSENIEGFPSHLCILGESVDKCLVDSYFVKQSKNTQGGTFSNNQDSNKLIGSLRTSSSSTVSVNSLRNLVIMEYPEIWKELNVVADKSYLDLVEMDKQELGSVYTSFVDSPALLIIDEAKESGWKIYKVDSYNENLPAFIYNFLTPLTKESLETESLLNDWQQGWQVDESGIYIAVYTPNILGYFGYLALFVLSTFIGIGFLVEKRKKYAKS